MTKATTSAVMERPVRRISGGPSSSTVLGAWQCPRPSAPLLRTSTLEAILTLAYDPQRRTYVLIRGTNGSCVAEDIDESVAIAITDEIERSAKLKTLHLSRSASDGLELNPKEVLVLQAVADGLTNRAVASKLRITENTVKRHNQHIFAKLGVQSRTQAVLVGLERGWITRAKA